MNYLLDTNVIIDHLHKKIAIENLPHETDQYITSVIVYAEILYGATEKQIPIIEALFTELHIQLITVDRTIIHEYIRLRKMLEEKGRTLEDFDLLIAATTLMKQAILLTRNTKHFSRIPGLHVA